MTNNHKVNTTVHADDSNMPAYSLSKELKHDTQTSVSDDSKKLQTSINCADSASTLTENLPCPSCGKSTLQAKFPDQNNVLTTCSSCGFTMGIKIDEWHRMEKSPNPKEHIKKMARRKELIGLA
jgi:hypothetical protein